MPTVARAFRLGTLPFVFPDPLHSPFGLLGLAATTAVPTPVQQWVAVRQRFQQFHRNVLLTEVQRDDGITKCRGVVNCLNRHYYGTQSEDDHGFMIGSWAKGTASRPPRDVDLYFVLADAQYHRFQRYVGNRQSALLQDVKQVVEQTFPNTTLRADGQVVTVRFNGCSVEVAPVFALTTGRYLICDTHAGGSYKETDPWAEVRFIDAMDDASDHNLRPMIQMLKAWQRWCNVPIKSFQLELVAAAFLAQSAWQLKGYFYYDWIFRDFFEFLHAQANRFVFVPGTNEAINIGSEWQSKAATAYHAARRACDDERDNYVYSAGEEWQKIFGLDIPQSV